MPTMMIVDESSFLKGVLKFILERGGHNVVGMTQGYEEALEMYRSQKPDIVFCDVSKGSLADGIQIVKAMKEIDIDISNNQTKSVFKLFKQGRIYHYVIAVCDAASAERCPIFPGITKRLNWSFEDPASFTGTDEEKLEKIRIVRDGIKAEVENFLKLNNLKSHVS